MSGLNILVVEGNSEERLAFQEANALVHASVTYAASLGLHAPMARIDRAFPYAPHRETDLLPIGAYDGFALTGSSVAWGAEMPEARPYLDFVSRLLDTGKPVLGSCWGMQTVCVLLGGMSGPNPLGSEIGIARDIKLTAAGRNHPLFENMPGCFAAPAFHRDHVTRMPENAVLLASNTVSEVQAMAYQTNGIDYTGFQFHPEIPLEHFSAEYRQRTKLPGTITELTDFPDIVPDEIADPMQRTRPLGNWLVHVERKKLGGLDELADTA